MLVPIGLVALLSGCAGMLAPQENTMNLPDPLRGKNAAPVDSDSTAVVSDQQSGERFAPTPVVGEINSVNIGSTADHKLEFSGASDKLEINVQDISLPAFINEVYGNLLRLDFYVSEPVSQLQDLVTFRITEPESPEAVFASANSVLETYGVSPKMVDHVLRFELMAAASGSVPPLIISGRAMPNVPVTHRPVFQIVRLNAVRVSEVAVWLKAAFDDNSLKLFEDHARSTIMLSGKASVVRQVIEMIDYFDQPAMRGRNSVKIAPVFWSALELAKELQKILTTEGYNVGLSETNSGVVLLPVSQTNTILAFAADPLLIDHVKEWVTNLDTPPKDRQETGFFSYRVENTSATGLASVLDHFTSELGQTALEGKKAEAGSAQSKLVVDEARNALVFFGQTDVWLQLLPLIREMDRADRMALIEVTIAEVQLTDQNQFGIEWLAKGAGINNEDGIVSTQGGLGLEPNGLSYILNSAGQTRAILSAFASSNMINVISTPRLMTRSGYPASINVGNEVPLITTQAQSEFQDSGSSAILQEVQYQKTGVSLNISPVIFSDNKISLDISQVVSDALKNETSSIDSPVIQNREISTSVTLEDGGSVLVAGLIRETKTTGINKVPGFGDIPVIGRLFRTDSDTVVKTELVILVVPYIVNAQEDAEEISQLYKKELGWDLQ